MRHLLREPDHALDASALHHHHEHVWIRCVTIDAGGDWVGIFTDYSAGTIRGITVRNAGTGVMLDTGAGTFLIDHCVFANNEHGLSVAADAYVSDSDFIGNSLVGVDLVMAAVGTARCRFLDNGLGVNVAGSGHYRADDCLFRGNLNGSVWLQGALGDEADGAFRTCTFYGEHGFRKSSRSALTIERCIVAFGELAGTCSGAPPLVMCTDSFANAGGDRVGCFAGLDVLYHNFSADPLFCNAAAGDLTLQPTSPCAPDNNELCLQVGAYGVGCGPVAVPPVDWGSIKARYRR